VDSARPQQLHQKDTDVSYPPGPPQGPYNQQPGFGQQGQQQPQYGFPQQGQQQPGYGFPQQAGYGGAPEYAGWWNRFGGTLVDGLVIGLPYGLLLGIGSAMRNAAGATLAVLGILYAVAMVLYQIYREGTTGQTIGKGAVNIRLVREADGQPLGFGMAFVRRIAHFLDSVACYVGWLWPAWDAKKQTFADKVCNTVVIKSS
jgi:uncharacterized RDD family membrane protein YckC